MGNYRYLRNRGHQVQDEWQGPPVKVIRPDGIVEVIKKPMMASELMRQHPGHYVCHSSAMIATLTMKSTLVGNRELEGGRLYYILPSHKFVQDEEEGKGLVCGQTSNSRSSSRKDFTLEIKQSKTSPGFAQVTVRGHVQDGASNNAIAHSSNPNFRNMYNSTRLPPQSWKPQLETINEVVQGTLSRRRNIESFVRWRSLRKS